MKKNFKKFENFEFFWRFVFLEVSNIVIFLEEYKSHQTIHHMKALDTLSSKMYKKCKISEILKIWQGSKKIFFQKFQNFSPTCRTWLTDRLHNIFVDISDL